MQAWHIIRGRLAAALAIIVWLPLLAACSPAMPPDTGITATATPGGAAVVINSDPGITATAAPGGATVVINMDIADRKTALARQDLRVKRGDTVSINFTADEPGEVHLHGYDLSAAVSPKEPGALTFDADTAGAFGLNFHVYAPATTAQQGDSTGGGTQHAGHGEMGDAPIASEVPISVSVAAVAEASGGVNISIGTEGWRWAPENVNAAYVPGEGHAHVYVDGVKINRVYGPYYHLTGLTPGEHRIRVTLNANTHNGLLVDGELVAAATMVTVPEYGGARNGGREPAVADGPMSLELVAHSDPLGGYNLEVIPAGFTFAGQKVNQEFVPGVREGHANVAIDGASHARLYEPWLKLPALEPGRHTVTVGLVTNDRRPYYWDDSPVEASVIIHAGPADAGGQSGQDEDGHHSHSHGSSDTAREVVAEVHLGNLEVYP